MRSTNRLAKQIGKDKNRNDEGKRVVPVEANMDQADEIMHAGKMVE